MGYRLERVSTPGGLSWLDIADIIEHNAKQPGSALRRVMLNDVEDSTGLWEWEQGMSLQSMFADMIDAYVSANSKRRQKPYPRPWNTKDGHKHFGKKPVTVAELKRLFGRGER